MIRAAAALLLLITGSAEACTLEPGDGTPWLEGPVRLAWRTEPAGIVVGEPFAIVFKACPTHLQLLALGATMPEHRHGMNYAPSLTPLGDGRWRAEGMLWHMSGRWRVRLEVLLEGQPHVLQQDVSLP
jgi:hypothetical protein